MNNPQPGVIESPKRPDPVEAYVIPEIISGWKETSRKPAIAIQLLAWFKANSPEGEFGVILKNAGLLKKIIAYENDCARNRRAQGHAHKRIFEIESLPGPVTHMRLDPAMVRIGRRFAMQYGHMHGTFRIQVTDSLAIFLISWGYSAKESGEMAIGPQKAFTLLYERLETKERRLVRSPPPKGVWDIRIKMLPGGMAIPYFVRKKLDDEANRRFTNHPKYDDLLKDVDDFFARIEFWTRNNQPGMRKAILIGPPGTGKTSIALALASLKSRDLLVVYADSSDGVIATASLAAEKQRRTVIVAEELDMLKHASANVLNWLDGSDTPRNVAGTYVITTTNFPRNIDPRILKRPGRIDTVLSVGALRSKDASRIATTFLPDDAERLDAKELGLCLDRTTPAEIREIVNLALRSLEPGVLLTVEHIANARADLKAVMKIAEELGDDDPDQREELHRKLGPKDDFF